MQFKNNDPGCTDRDDLDEFTHSLQVSTASLLRCIEASYLLVMPYAAAQFGCPKHGGLAQKDVGALDSDFPVFFEGVV